MREGCKWCGRWVKPCRRFLKTRNHDVIKVDPPRKTESRALGDMPARTCMLTAGSFLQPGVEAAQVSTDRHTGKPQAGGVPTVETVQPSDPCTHLVSHHPHIHPCALLTPLHHPAVGKCLLAHSVSGHPLRGAGHQGAPRCPPPHCRQGQRQADSCRSRRRQAEAGKAPPTKGAGETFRGG